MVKGMVGTLGTRTPRFPWFEGKDGDDFAKFFSLLKREMGIAPFDCKDCLTFANDPNLLKSCRKEN